MTDWTSAGCVGCTNRRPLDADAFPGGNIVQARSLVLACVLCGCGGRTSLDEAVPVDAATVDVNAVILDASAADVGDLDGPQLIGPDAESVGDADVMPDACISPYDRDSSAMCVTRTDCCQVAIGTSCLGGRCIPDHQQ